MSDVLPGVLRGVRGAAGGGALAKVRRAWAEAVGEAVAKRTRVAACEGGKIRVEVASAALKHDLATFRAPQLLEGLRNALPELRLKELSFRVAALS